MTVEIVNEEGLFAYVNPVGILTKDALTDLAAALAAGTLALSAKELVVLQDVVTRLSNLPVLSGVFAPERPSVVEAERAASPYPDYVQEGTWAPAIGWTRVEGFRTTRAKIEGARIRPEDWDHVLFLATHRNLLKKALLLIDHGLNKNAFHGVGLLKNHATWTVRTEDPVEKFAGGSAFALFGVYATAQGKISGYIDNQNGFGPLVNARLFGSEAAIEQAQKKNRTLREGFAVRVSLKAEGLPETATPPDDMGDFAAVRAIIEQRNMEALLDGGAEKDHAAKISRLLELVGEANPDLLVQAGLIQTPVPPRRRM
jgi:hypothetical protein